LWGGAFEGGGRGGVGEGEGRGEDEGCLFHAGKDTRAGGRGGRWFVLLTLRQCGEWTFPQGLKVPHSIWGADGAAEAAPLQSVEFFRSL
jgi:hypothetical protein